MGSFQEFSGHCSSMSRNSRRLWPRPIQPVHKADTPTWERKERNPRTHPEQLLQGTEQRALSLETRPGSWVHSWGNQQGDKRQQIRSRYSQDSCICQEGREAKEKIALEVCFPRHEMWCQLTLIASWKFHLTSSSPRWDQTSSSSCWS